MRRKYRNRKVYSEEHGVFDSIKEYHDFLGLLIRKNAGLIEGLIRQVPFPLVVENNKIGKLTIDFVYYDNELKNIVAHETKGYKTRDYILRAKLFKALYPEIIFIES